MRQAARKNPTREKWGFLGERHRKGNQIYNEGVDMDEVRWDEIQDIVVIGAGFAGLTAAIEAYNCGASVIVLEKMQAPGATPSSVMEASRRRAHRYSNGCT